MLRRYRLDLTIYGGFAAFALVTALTAAYGPHRVWGWYAVGGYLLGGVVLLATGRRWVAVWVSAGGCVVAPLVHLVAARSVSGGDFASDPFRWHAQPEVWIIERSSRLLLATGSPYVDVAASGRAPTAFDYAPYGPVMAVFGLPSAFSGVDVRVVFLLVTGVCVAAAGWLLHRWRTVRVPVEAAYAALTCPATALHVAVAGDDAVVIGLILLELALGATRRPSAAGVVGALAVCAKLIAIPAVVVLVFLLPRRLRARAAATFTATVLVVMAPVIAVDGKATVQNMLAFPLGRTPVASPAASPLPGHLLADTGTAGLWVAVALLVAAATAMTVWVVRRPPVDVADACLRLAVGLAAAIVLSPTSRWGYVIYPLALLGARAVSTAPEPAVELPRP